MFPTILEMMFLLFEKKKYTSEANKTSEINNPNYFDLDFLGTIFGVERLEDKSLIFSSSSE